MGQTLTQAEPGARAPIRFLSSLAIAALVAGCDTLPNPLRGGEASRGAAAQGVALIERDVEAPEVYEARGRALWDGRPSLGGVWVAAADVDDPERVIIRDEETGKFVIGALFKRQRDKPGPALDLSSDAAAALGIVAGRPTEISVVALRREEVAEPHAAPSTTAPNADARDAPPIAAEEIVRTAAAPEVGVAPLGGVGIAASSDPALDRALAAGAPAAQTLRPVAAPAPAPTSALERSFVQVGIFSVAENAENTAEAFRQAGVVPTVKREESAGKAFWRVILGPALTESDRSAVLRKARDLGFADAYPVRG